MDPAVLQTQRLLSMAGLSPGPLDGIRGSKTSAALSAFIERDPRYRSNPDRSILVWIQENAGLVPRLSIETMQAIAPAFPPEWITPLNEALLSALILDDRAAYFLSQMAHESAGFETLEEYGRDSYFSRYDGRSDLGNINPGDGLRYKGRGVIQLTGRANYRRYGLLTGLPLEEHPEIVASPLIGFRIAAEYWTGSNLNALTDAGDFLALTRRINGGLNGLSSRKRFYRRASAALDTVKST